MKGITLMFISILIILIVPSLWEKFPVIKNSVHAILDPTAGFLLSWNLTMGFIILIAVLSFFIMLTQKFLTNQEELKKIKGEQKILREEMEKYRNHPEKLTELSKKQLEFIPKTMDITMKPMLYTIIPFILLFRWFDEFFINIWGRWWIFYYIIGSLIFSSIFRKVLKVA